MDHVCLLDSGGDDVCLPFCPVGATLEWQMLWGPTLVKVRRLLCFRVRDGLTETKLEICVLKGGTKKIMLAENLAPRNEKVVGGICIVNSGEICICYFCEAWVFYKNFSRSSRNTEEALSGWSKGKPLHSLYSVFG